MTRHASTAPTSTRKAVESRCCSTAATVDLEGTAPLPLFAAMLAKAEAAEPAVWENIDAMRRAIEGGEFGRR